MTENQEQNSTQNAVRLTGIVKFYNIIKGFGFVKDLNSSDEFFVHATSITQDDEGRSRVLYDGEYIEFETVDGDKGKQCTNITGIQGGTLLCDVNNRLNSRNRRGPRDSQNDSAEVTGQLV
jgi:CspA family cold shock protein